ncbi:PREDICTED: uncharacterized protein LOC106814066 [Priapulus caudatus]|uniref:Uncharacterized protein LOC106814066 n=1 Tax=Priapulus caudatus TaxID=37621 RepID=A0ABM1ENQ1_PRICU|nr:PREDICTED: uncharacterized protein LOC106814066 [Priapulus caudatus]
MKRYQTGAKADAARAKADYAHKEAEIRRRQLKIKEETDLLQVDLDVLRSEKEAAIAEAEAKAHETFTGSQDNLSETSRPRMGINVEFQSSAERTMRYAAEHDASAIQKERDTLDKIPMLQAQSKPENYNVVTSDIFRPEEHRTRLSSRATEFHPRGIQPDISANVTESPNAVHTATDLTRLLLKKELLGSRLINYNDRPESYASWKMTFRNVTQELQVTAIEELDLLVRWLGPESSGQAQSLRAASPLNPGRGLQRVWERLDDRYGAPEKVEAALKWRLESFSRITGRDNKKLYELSDILAEIEAVKEDPQYQAVMAYFDSSSGINPIVNRLPYGMQEKWTTSAQNYKRKYGVTFPPFSHFVEFIREIARVKNDPSFLFESSDATTGRKDKNAMRIFQSDMRPLTTRKVEISDDKVEVDPERLCPIHKLRHTLNQCRSFKRKPIHERRKLLREFGICFKCCASSKHAFRNCKEAVECEDCGSKEHATALHVWSNMSTCLHTSGSHGRQPTHGGEYGGQIRTKCTQICGPGFVGKSCAKTLLVSVHPQGHPEMAVRTYAVIDDQSNRSLGKSELFDRLHIDCGKTAYTLSTCAGQVEVSGRRANNIIIKSLDGTSQLTLHTMIECDEIPDAREEIATPEVAMHHAHLCDIAKHLPPIDGNASILLLIGRDLIEAHHILEQRTGPPSSPYAHRLRLGWVIVGEACLGKVHRSEFISVRKTYLLPNGRTTILAPCTSTLKVKETFKDRELGVDMSFEQVYSCFALNVLRTEDDDKPGLSVEDREFLHIMEKSMFREEHGNLVAPLPFRNPKPRLPNNRPQAMKPLDTNASLRKDRCEATTLCGVHGLLGILLRFRQHSVAVSSDNEQMFYCFKVTEDHRNYLRFLWYKDNNPEKELIEYRMGVHVFGNSPSPAVATYGLRKVAQAGEEVFGADVKEFVTKNFYIDDGLVSLASSKEAVDLIKRTQGSGGNIRLHKISSNNKEVMKAFLPQDLAKDLKDLDLGNDLLPLQRSLGLVWDLETDSFTFRVSEEEKPYTRRGVLSTVNSLYDPLGFVAPVVIQGKLLLRALCAETQDWDDPLPVQYRGDWERWRDSLKSLEDLHIRRTYVDLPFKGGTRKEIHIFSDASESAIAAVVYLKCSDSSGKEQIGFIIGKSKVAPKSGHTIPRLELCAAVLATELSRLTLDELEFTPDAVRFYTDSKVVLGYINNRSRRFYMYVANRVAQIRRWSNPEQWSYVRTEMNPADCATRCLSPEKLNESLWLSGPTFVGNSDSNDEVMEHELVDPEDKEVRPEIVAMATKVGDPFWLQKARKFSSWKRFVKAIALLRCVVRNRRGDGVCGSDDVRSESKTVKSYRDTEQFILREVQKEAYSKELQCIRERKPLPNDSSILKLNPFDVWQ